MTTVVNNLKIEFVDGQIKIDGFVVSFKGSKSLYNEIVNNVSNLGAWWIYGMNLKK
jgi:hypothetical protein